MAGLAPATHVLGIRLGQRLKDTGARHKPGKTEIVIA